MTKTGQAMKAKRIGEQAINRGGSDGGGAARRAPLPAARRCALHLPLPLCYAGGRLLTSIRHRWLPVWLPPLFGAAADISLCFTWAKTRARRNVEDGKRADGTAFMRGLAEDVAQMTCLPAATRISPPLIHIFCCYSLQIEPYRFTRHRGAITFTRASCRGGSKRRIRRQAKV